MPTRRSAVAFRLKAAGLQLRRAALDWRRGLRRLPRRESQDFPFALVSVRTPLRSPGLSAAERALENGKIQNLRAAALRLDGTLLGAGEEFSFWKQVGRATPRRGFARGRLLREGCLVPAVGGGLCQLSNALYEAALQAGLTVTERYAHSRTVPGSSAALGRDATVAWNYIDLRFFSERPLLLEVLLTADELIVCLRSPEPLPKPQPDAAPLNFIPLSAVARSRPWLDADRHSCASCGEQSCFRHQKHVEPTAIEGRTLFLLDEAWPEFVTWAASQVRPGDAVAAPRWSPALHPIRPRGTSAPLAALERSLRARRASGAARRNQAAIVSNERLARALSSAFEPDIERVVLAQSLLPFVWKLGLLGGRRFEVLMTRPPLLVLHKYLDDALLAYPERAQLREFRAPADLARAEERALRAASTCMTPHAHLAQALEALGLSVRRLAWSAPSASAPRRLEPVGRAIAFPGPTAARKGAHDVRAVARELDVEIVLLGSELEGGGFWDGVRVRHVAPGSNWMGEVTCVVQPALLEEQPRVLLRALAQGVAVVATPECGLSEDAGGLLRLVQFGDAAGLRAAVTGAMDDRRLEAALPNRNDVVI